MYNILNASMNKILSDSCAGKRSPSHITLLSFPENHSPKLHRQRFVHSVIMPATQVPSEGDICFDQSSGAKYLQNLGASNVF